MTFSWPILPKKIKLEKMAIFGEKPWVNPLGKMSKCQMSKSCKNGLFWAKPWVNPFEKKENISTIRTSCF